MGFDMNAASIVSHEAKTHGGPHKIRWPGCQIGPDTTLEFRVIISGTSLEEVGQPVGNEVALLPMPSQHEHVEVCVILGSIGPTSGYPPVWDKETCVDAVSDAAIMMLPRALALATGAAALDLRAVARRSGRGSAT